MSSISMHALAAPLLVVASAFLVAAEGGPATGAPVSVEEIVARHLAAQGGLARLDAVGSLRATGNYVLGDGSTAPFVQERKRPGAVRLELLAPNQPTTVLATDGATAWELHLGAEVEVETLPPQQTARYARQIAIDGPLILAHRLGRPITLVGREEVGGQSLWRLQVIWESGERSDLFLDATTYLLARMDDYWRIGPDEIRIEILYTDYRAVDGIPFPHRVEQITSQGAWRFEVDQVTANVPIGDDRFRPPATGA